LHGLNEGKSMNVRTFLASVLLFSIWLPARSQQTNPQPPAPPTPESTPGVQRPSAAQVDNDDVVRITTNLVQVDVVVTDKSGKHISDLKPEEFELLEDGRPQPITNFSYALNEPTAITTGSATTTGRTPVDRILPTAPPSPLPPEQVRRTIALTVDDLGLSFESMGQMRRVLRKFVDEQMQPGDLVAIIRTGGDMGALQQFTNDKRLLYKAIERVRWNICSRAGISIVPAMRAGADVPNGGCPPGRADETLRALRFIVQGMRELPGRKSLIMLSDGIPSEQQESPLNPFDPNAEKRLGRFATENESTGGGNTISYLEPLRRVAELAIRASVVIYGIDTRGVVYAYGATAADDFSGMSWEKRGELIRQRGAAAARMVDGPASLARQTGGLMIQGTNDIYGGVRRVMDDQKGYYLLGYQPGGEIFDRRFHHLKVGVKRKGMTVRTRAGFFGITEDDARKALAPRDQTLAALISPFGATDINVRLTALYADTPSTGRVMRSFLHIDATRLTFSDEPDGWHTASFELTGLLFGDNGRVAGEHSQTEKLRVRGQAYERLLQDGLAEVFSMPVKKKGIYQLRVAVRDLASSRLGAAGQVVEVPDLGGNSLALSGLILSNSQDMDAALKQFNNEGEPETKNEAEASGPAVRQLRADMTPGYAFYIYNARLGQGARPSLKMQVRLLRDGKQVFTSGEKPLVFDQIGDPNRLLVTSRLMPDERLPPGEYGLQVVVTDMLAKGQKSTVTQSMDFEVMK
jgi:VWFA-related protein